MASATFDGDPHVIVVCNDGAVFLRGNHTQGWRETEPIPGTLRDQETKEQS